MRAVMVHEPGRLEVVDVPAPVPGPGEVVVDVAFSGICGSDVEVLRGTRPPHLVRYPVLPGHEWSGTVAKVGPGVDVHLLGRMAVGEGFRPCRTCQPCRRGDTTLCDGYSEQGFTAPGSWAEQLLLPADRLHVLADGADLRAAAALEPSACAFDAVRRAAIRREDAVCVIGAGTIGLLAVQLIRSLAPRELVVVEREPGRAAIASRVGADSWCTPEQAAFRGSTFDVVVEAAGADTTAQLAVDLACKGGRVVLAGMFGSDAHVAASDLVTKRLRVETVFGADRDAWTGAVAAFETGVLNPAVLVTHVMALAQVADAIDLVAARRADVGKVLLHP